MLVGEGLQVGIGPLARAGGDRGGQIRHVGPLRLRQRSLLEREAVDEGIEQGKGVGDHRHGEAPVQEAADDRVVVSQVAGRAGREVDLGEHGGHHPIEDGLLVGDVASAMTIGSVDRSG